MIRFISLFITIILSINMFVGFVAFAEETSSVPTIVSSSTTMNSSTTTTVATQTQVDNVARPSKPLNFTAVESINSVSLNWNIVSDANGYSVSRSFDRGKWKRIARFDGNINSYVDTEPLSDVACYYSVKAFKYVNGKRKFSKKSNVVQIFYGMNLYACSYKNSVTLNWQSVEDVTGYEVYYSENNFDFNLVYDVVDSQTTSYTHENITPFKTKYYFYIKAYKTIDKENKEYIITSNTVCANDVESIVNGSVREPRTFFKTTNVQGNKPKLQEKVQITEDDKKIIANFESKFLTKDMSPYYKAYYTLKFINRKVKYANSDELWAKISNSSYVDAIFNKRTGQCAQYNGAMVAYLANMGLNAKLMLGYRGYSLAGSWQHYWGQVRLKNGKYYVVETGNYGNDGDWYYFFKPYSETKKFIKCGKYVSGIS